MNEQLLEWLSAYGLSAYFAILVISSAGVPFPITLMLMVVGSLVEQGEFPLWQVLILGSAGAIIGDNIGYIIGRYGGRRLLTRVARKFGGEGALQKAHDFTKKWGGAGIFFSRWLITPLGPWLNLTSGATDYAWSKFLLWDVLGEILWVVLYVMLGEIFSDSVQYAADVLGSATWVIAGLLVASVLGWKLFRLFRSPDEQAA